MKKKIINSMGRLTTVVMAAVILTLAGVCSTAAVAKKATPAKKSMTLEQGSRKTIVVKNKKKGAVYSFKTSNKKIAAVSKKGLVTAKKVGKASVTVFEKIKKKTKKIASVKVSVIAKKAVQTSEPITVPTAAPTISPTIAPTVVPTTEPTPNPTPEPTKDVYSKEVFAINISNTDTYTVAGNTCDVNMTYFDATAEGEFFNGKLIRNAESSIVTKDYKDGSKVVCGRYMFTGKDNKGNNCKIFVEDNNVGENISKPVIITDSPELEFLLTADLQGRIETTGDGESILHIMWNEDNTEPVEFPAVVRPDESNKYTEELFTFTIGIGASDEVKGTDASASMINFTCKSDCDAFKGEGVANFVDSRMQFKGQVQTLSARYIMEGTDDQGNDCKIYVENNGIDDNGMVTEPIIITDNPKWANIETAKLHGTVSWSPSLTIHIWANPDTVK